MIKLSGVEAADESDDEIEEDREEEEGADISGAEDLPQ